MQAVKDFDHAEHHKGHDQEVQHRVEKVPQHQGTSSGQLNGKGGQGRVIPCKNA